MLISRIQGVFSSKARVASVFVLITYALSQILRLGSNLVLTRLLVPEMFGVMALAFTFSYIVAMISDVGIETSIIKSINSDEKAFLQTAWTAQIIRGFILFVLIVFISYIVYLLQLSQFFKVNSTFDSPLLPNVLAALSLTALISGFKSTKVSLANRNLSLGKLSLIELMSQLISIITMLILASMYKSIWALVIGALLASLLSTIFGHIFLPGKRDSLGWEKKSFYEIFTFGKWILISSIITALLYQGDKLIFGNYLSAETLGIYSIALLLSSAAKDVLLKLNSKVFFPKMSCIHRENSKNIADIYYSIRKKTDAISFIVAGLLFVSGPNVVNILFDSRYQYAGELLSILGLQLLFTSTIVSGALYLSIGKPKFLTINVFFETLFKLLLIYILFEFGGLEFAIYGCAFFGLLVLPIDFYFKRKLKVLKLKNEILMLPTFFIGISFGYIFNLLAEFFA